MSDPRKKGVAERFEAAVLKTARITMSSSV